MERQTSWCCARCSQPILPNDLIAWTKKEAVVHLICGAAELQDGIRYIGSAGSVLDETKSS